MRSTYCRLVSVLFAVALFGVPAPSIAGEDLQRDDWDSIWSSRLPEPESVTSGDLGGLGEELESKPWLMIPTVHHQILYQPSVDPHKLSQIHALIDNVYEFLEERSPTTPNTPIRVFLVPDEWGRSRCSPDANAMRTGDRADAQFMLASLIHEETHLFNLSFLGGKKQGWWSGEFTCIYFQQRALWEVRGKDIREELVACLPDGPRCSLREIEARNRAAFDEAIAALHYFEATFGRARAIRFRTACLEHSRRTDGGPLSVSIFERTFGRNIDQLEADWRTFYGSPARGEEHPSSEMDSRLLMPVTCTVEKDSVQSIVRRLVESAGLVYGWKESQANAGSLCKSWVRDLDIRKRPLHEALSEILRPRGLVYTLENSRVVLHVQGGKESDE